jgi:hypothetical protein
MSPDEVRACYQLYSVCRMSRAISPFRRVLASLAVRLRHRSFMETLAQIANMG